MTRRRPQPKRTRAPRRLPPLFSGLGLLAGYVGAYTLGVNVLGALGASDRLSALLAGGAAAAGLVLWGRNKQLETAPSPALLKAVDRVSRDMDGIRDTAQLCNLVVGALNKALKPTKLYIWLPSRNAPVFYLAAGVGPYPQHNELPEAWIQDFFDYLSDDVLNPVDLPPNGSKFSRWLTQRRLSLCLPIVSHGRLIGLLTAGEKANRRDYTGSDRWLLNQLARQTALALSYIGLQNEGKQRKNDMDNLVYLYKDAQQRAVTDALTGLGTRLFFDEQLGARFNEALRYQQPLSLMLVDVDHFKQFNDRFGHQAGDAVLREVAQALKTEVRACDTVARYGGEELAVVMPQTDLEGAVILAERIRRAVEALDIEDPLGRRLPVVTASIGVAELAMGDRAPATLIERADKALYEAKRSGRNRVCADAGDTAKFA